METQKVVNHGLEVRPSTDFTARIEQCFKNSAENQKPFFIIVVQLANMEAFKKRRPPHVVAALMREIGGTVRRAVHHSQYVGYHGNGLGLVFDAVDSGEVDKVARKLVMIVQNTIRMGRYNDFTGKWTDIVYSFLHPGSPAVIFPKAGWAIGHRDGNNANALIQRAVVHLNQQDNR